MQDRTQIWLHTPKAWKASTAQAAKAIRLQLHVTKNLSSMPEEGVRDSTQEKEVYDQQTHRKSAIYGQQPHGQSNRWRRQQRWATWLREESRMCHVAFWLLERLVAVILRLPYDLRLYRQPSSTKSLYTLLLWIDFWPKKRSSVRSHPLPLTVAYIRTGVWEPRMSWSLLMCTVDLITKRSLAAH